MYAIAPKARSAILAEGGVPGSFPDNVSCGAGFGVVGDIC